PCLARAPPRYAPHPDAPSPLTSNNRAHHRLLRSTRAVGEQAAAELKQRWRALKHITLSLSRIGPIAQAALVLNSVWKWNSLRKRHCPTGTAQHRKKARAGRAL